jgi:hypothetical protein
VTVQTKIAPAPEPYGMFLREREYSAKLERLLSRAVALLESETDRRERAGDDVAHLRGFIREVRSV